MGTLEESLDIVLIEGLLDHLRKYYSGHVPSDQIETAARNPKLAVKLLYGLYIGAIDDVADPESPALVKNLKPVAPGKEQISKEERAIQFLLGKKSRWIGKKDSSEPRSVEQSAQAMVEEIKQNADPTGGKYLIYIARQLAFGRIRLPEDSHVLKQVLETFEKRGRDWIGEDDIFDYDNWRDLQTHTMEYEELKSGNIIISNRQVDETFKAQARASSDIVAEQTVTTHGGQVHFTVVECRRPAAVAYWGRIKGPTNWCTTASVNRLREINQHTHGHKTFQESIQTTLDALSKDPKRLSETPWVGWSKEDFLREIYRQNGWKLNTPIEKLKNQKEYHAPNPYLLNAYDQAKYYIDNYGGPIYIVYKNNKPYMQFVSNGQECMNVEDTPLGKVGVALGKVLWHLITTGKVNEEFGEAVKPKIRLGLKDAGLLK